MAERRCSVDGCARPAQARGWCKTHWARWRKYGTVDAGRPVSPVSAPPLVRFLTHVALSVDGCWEWTGSVSPKGYGYFHNGVRLTTAHRWSYEHFVGPVPDGLHIDHLCRNRRCARPDHLEAVTPGENQRRGDLRAIGQYQRSKTHCPKGHPYDEQNTRYKLTGNGYLCRVCKACEREKARQRRA